VVRLPKKEAEFLAQKTDSPNEIKIIAVGAVTQQSSLCTLFPKTKRIIKTSRQKQSKL
jgi:hypothetical protein